ncbi:MAG: hypothetical protein HPY90_10710 [Syntrophothermus sp.]|uniref:hypothetical protein n=1 Tax=Syntrophothermus sp. TaxID=2736299 RepID=UPI00257CF901|nr:hypothetical protein [Syntrophothermus sp.]NSW83719.1 hypothetical protein [Syntrophothermus sp.]
MTESETGRERAKPIRLSRHARENALYRGSTEEEILETIRTGFWEAAQDERWECRKNFAYREEWNG